MSKTIKIEYCGIEGSGATVAAARQDAAVKIAALVRDLTDVSPMIVKCGAWAKLVYRGAHCWCSVLLTGDNGEVRGGPVYGSTETRPGPLRSRLGRTLGMATPLPGGTRGGLRRQRGPSRSQPPGPYDRALPRALSQRRENNAMNATIRIELRDVYGQTAAYPCCATSRLFAAIAGTKTLTAPKLALIRSHGFKIEVMAHGVLIGELAQ